MQVAKAKADLAESEKNRSSALQEIEELRAILLKEKERVSQLEVQIEELKAAETKCEEVLFIFFQ